MRTLHLSTAFIFTLLVLCSTLSACSKDDDGNKNNNTPTGQTTDLTQGDHLVKIEFGSGPLAGTTSQFSIDYEELSSTSVPESQGNRQVVAFNQDNYQISLNFIESAGQALPFDPELVTVYFSIEVLNGNGEPQYQYIMQGGQINLKQFTHHPLTSFMGYGSYIVEFDAEFMDIIDMDLHLAQIKVELTVKRR